MPNNDLNKFIVRVRDPESGDFRPVYTLPDATDNIKGGVTLSDSVSGSENASDGIKAATPLAVSTVNENANTRLSKTDENKQNVVSDVSFKKTVSADGGFKGDLTGNALTASKLKNKFKLSVDTSNGQENNLGISSVSIDGSEGSGDGQGVTLAVKGIDASLINSGKISINRLPKAAIERMRVVQNDDARFALTKEDVQNGDTVYVDGSENVPPKMYYVVNEDELDRESGYKEYQAGTASKLGASDVGSGRNPIYLDDGSPVAFTESVGDSKKPVYMDGGTIKEIGYTIEASVPADANFHDTTYVDMVGASESSDGESGLVPAPAAGKQDLFLKADGTWAEAGKVKSVNGNTGDVTITASDIGALPLSGGTVSGAILPSDATVNIGSTDNMFGSIYSNAFIGNLTGTASNASNAVTAQNLNKNIVLSGAISSASTSLAQSSNTVTISTELKDNSVTFEKLAPDVKGVYVGSNTPGSSIAEHIGIWVKI